MSYQINGESAVDEDDGDSPKTLSLDSGKKFIWKGMTTAELTRHMGEIRACLPPTALKDMNMEEEMLLQLHVLRELQTSVITDDKIALNQRVQAANTLGKAISDVADRQVEIYTSERFKRIENILIRAVRDHLEEEAAAQFLNQYDAMAREGDA